MQWPVTSSLHRSQGLRTSHGARIQKLETGVHHPSKQRKEGAFGKDGEKTRNKAKQDKTSEATLLVEIRVADTEIST